MATRPKSSLFLLVNRMHGVFKSKEQVMCLNMTEKKVITNGSA